MDSSIFSAHIDVKLVAFQCIFARLLLMQIFVMIVRLPYPVELFEANDEVYDETQSNKNS